MLLRSVTKHVKDQNWFAVFLDLVIVVFGVFVGIQVSNWNADRVGEEKAKVLVNRLIVEIGHDHEAITAVVEYHAVVKKYAVQAIDGFHGEETVSDEQFVIAAYQASQISDPWSYRSTYIEMLSTGQFDLVKNDHLKSLIFAYYAENWTEQKVLNTFAPYREYIRGEIPFRIQDAIRNECGDISFRVAQTFAYKLTESCDLQLPDELFSETAAFLRSQPEMLSKLQYQIAVSESQSATLSAFGIEAEMLKTAIVESQ